MSVDERYGSTWVSLTVSDGERTRSILHEGVNPTYIGGTDEAAFLIVTERLERLLRDEYDED